MNNGQLGPVPAVPSVRPGASGLPRLSADGVVVCDGAMGTMLYAAGAPVDRALSELNVTAPGLVKDLHRAYATAGARIIQTNTFDANRLRLARFGLGGSAVEFNIAGARLAREAVRDADPPVLVAGSIGPAISATAPPRLPQPARTAALREQVAALADWVDLIILETFGDIESLAAAVQAALSGCDLPVLAQMAFADDGRTLRGEKPAELAAAVADLGVSAVGANCSAGPSVLHDVVAELAAACSAPISVQPNAGIPLRLGRYLRYAHNTGYFAQAAARFVAEGATIVGGCCGTTPAHIRAIARTVAGTPAPRPLAAVPRPHPPARRPAVPAPQPARPAAPRWPRQGFSVIAGLRAPQGHDVDPFVELARRLSRAGAHFLAITDPAPPMARVTPVAVGIVVHERVGAELILPFETADRSLSALQADLLGAHALGMRTIVCRTGTSRVLGDYPEPGPPEAGSQWDIDSIRLVAAMSGLNDGVDWRGVAIPYPTQFVIGAFLSPSAADLDAELDRAQEKVRAGAHFLMTDIIYDVAKARRALSGLRRRGVGLPVLAAIAPYDDDTHLDRLVHEVPETSSWPASLRGPRRPPSAQDAVTTAVNAAAALADLTSGIVVHASPERGAQLPELISILIGEVGADG